MSGRFNQLAAYAVVVDSCGREPGAMNAAERSRATRRILRVADWNFRVDGIAEPHRCRRSAAHPLIGIETAGSRPQLSAVAASPRESLRS